MEGEAGGEKEGGLGVGRVCVRTRGDEVDISTPHEATLHSAFDAEAESQKCFWH